MKFMKTWTTSWVARGREGEMKADLLGFLILLPHPHIYLILLLSLSPFLHRWQKSWMLAPPSPSVVTEISIYSCKHQFIHPPSAESPRGSATLCHGPTITPLTPHSSQAPSHPATLMTSLSAYYPASLFIEKTQTIRFHFMMVNSMYQFGYGALTFGQIDIAVWVLSFKCN